MLCFYDHLPHVVAFKQANKGMGELIKAINNCFPVF